MENTISKRKSKISKSIFTYKDKTIPYKEEMRNIFELFHEKSSFY